MKLAFTLLLHLALAVSSGVTFAVALTRGTRDARLVRIARRQAESTNDVGEKMSKQTPDVAEILDKELKKTEVMIGRLSHFDFPKKAAAFSVSMKQKFLPDWHFQSFIAWNALCFVSLAVFWFTIYLWCFYEDDRRSGFGRWQTHFDAAGLCPLSPRDSKGKGILSTPDVPDISPDIIIQFHHPSEDRLDKNFLVLTSSLEQILTDDSEDTLVALTGLLPECADDTMTAVMSRQVSRPDSKHPTYSAVRIAMLQDFCSLLPALGFSVLLFSSIDDDELFMCVSLHDEKAMKYYLKRNQPHLQLRHDVTRGLRISQDPNEIESSPPFIPYDPALVKRLHEAQIGSGNAESVYRTFYNKDGETLINSATRAEYICKEIRRFLNLDEAVRQGLILSWYPVHNALRVQELWVSWADWHHGLDFSFVQPMQEINAYFGSRVAFVFAWNGTYCKALLSITALALTWEATVFLCRVAGVATVDRKQIIGFSIILAIWSKWAACIWEREETFFLKDWDLEKTTSSTTNKMVRADFFGEMGTSPLDDNREELQYPRKKYIARQGFANIITLTYAAAVFLAYQIYMSLFLGKPMPLAFCVVLSAMIKVFELIFAKLVVVLTNFENHKYHDDYYNSYLWKYFLVQFVNNYSAFFFYSISAEKLSANCEPVDPVFGGDCLRNFRRQLSVALLILTMCSIAQPFVDLLLVKAQQAFELWKIKRAGKVPPPISSAEAQGKLNAFETREQIDAMLPNILSLGHVLLFGAVAPIVIPFCFVNFAVQLRAAACQQIFTFKRGFPHASLGIGSWKHIIIFLRTAGVIYSGFLFVAYGESFEGCGVLSKTTGFLLFLTSVGLIWTLVGTFVPKHDSVTQTLEGRREYVLRKLFNVGIEEQTPRGDIRKLSSQNSLDMGSSVPRGQVRRKSVRPHDVVALRHKDAVMEENWSEIPQLHLISDITETY